VIRGRAGFTLVELLVALTLLSVGVLGATGTLLAARATLVDAERLHVATQAAADVADSLLAVPAPGAGSRDAPWGRLSWSVDAGGLRVTADDGAGAPLLDWWIPGRVGSG
jgi:type IV pilus assembly protein PilV